MTAGDRRQFDVSTEQGRADSQAYLREQLTPPLIPGAAESGPITRVDLQQRGALTTPRFLPIATGARALWRWIPFEVRRRHRGARHS
jgi:hypothetical protein